MKSKTTSLILSLLSFAVVLPAQAQILAFADFSTFNDGNLVGQQGWQQYLPQSTNPIQVDGGIVEWPGDATTNDQDAFLPFPMQLTQPVSGVTTFYMAMRLAITSAGDNPAYFAALNTLTTNVTNNNFQNARLVARDNGSGTGFNFGARVNGQAGYPFAYGTEDLDYNTVYTLVAQINMVAGNANDTIRLFVNPPSADFNSLTPYATAQYSSGNVNDPSFGAFLLSQFGTVTVIQSGVQIERLVATFDPNQAFAVIPEPTTFTIILAAGMMYFLVRKRVHSKIFS
jgi:hypothetical protein